jgi:hypothetical protein
MFFLKRCFYTGLLLFLTFTTQAGIPVDTWRTHFSYNDVSQVEVAEDIVYAVSNGKLFSLSSGSIQTYTTLDDLSGFDVSFIAWCEVESTLVIVYSDGNIDFLSASGITNLPDFKNKSLVADKTVYNLKIQGSQACLSTGVGLLLIDVHNKLITETYKPLVPTSSHQLVDAVYDAYITTDTLLLATSDGLFAGLRSDNLQDPSRWFPLSFVAGKIPLKMLKFNETYVVYADDGSLYYNDGTTWKLIVTNKNIKNIINQGASLFVGASNKGYIIDRNWVLKTINNTAKDISLDVIDSVFYVASGVSGLSTYQLSAGQFHLVSTSISPSGPDQETAWNAFFKNDQFFSTSGGRWSDRYSIKGAVFSFDDETWANRVNRDSVSRKTGLPFLDILNLAIDPYDESHFFLTSWGEGLYEFRDSVFYKLHSYNNSPLITALPNFLYPKRFCRVDGATFDNEGNLWVLNSTYGNDGTKDLVLSDTTLWVLKPDGTWKGFYYPKMPGAPTWNSILFTSKGQIWCNSVRGISYGLFIVDQNGTRWDTSDDKTAWYSTLTDQDGLSISNLYTFNCMAEDQNGTIWIGTNQGPILATNTSTIFNSDYTFTRVKIPRNDGSQLADYLLDGVRVNCVAIDGANRKWIGTNDNGVYLVSSDGTEMIHQFNVDNSPIPSDCIYSIAINPVTGEVFIGTSKGLVSYRSDATTGSESYTDARVFPNPVTPGYSGLITVTGLKQKSQIKITDLSGNLIISGTSLGGQFTWNGYTSRGKRASSGVYLVFCADEDGLEYQVCKFMIVN